MARGVGVLVVLLAGVGMSYFGNVALYITGVKVTVWLGILGVEYVTLCPSSLCRTSTNV
jgi:hypothetical protein